MADTKKVIRMLNNTLRHCHNLYNHVTSEEQTWLAEINQGAKEALELLEEQKAEQPIVHENSYGWKFYYCPKCKQEFYQNRKQAYCDKCGQAVRWK